MPLAILAFLTGIAYLPGITSAAYAPRWWVLVVLAPALLLTRRVHMTQGHWLGMGFVLAAAASLLWSVSPLDTGTALVQLAALAMVFCLAAEQQDLQPVWLALGFGALASVLAALVQIAVPGLVPGMGLSGLFYQQDFFGSYCAVALIALVFGVRPKQPIYLLAGILALASLAGLLLSASRGAILAAGGAFAIMGVLRQPTAKRRWLALAVVLLAGILASFAFYRLMPHRQEAIDMRFLEWDWVMQNLKWLGWGYGTLGSVLPFEHAENEFLELAFDLGALSLAFWLLVAHAFKGYRHAPASAAVLAALLANSLAAFPLHNPATAMVAAVALGGLYGRRNRLCAAGYAGAVGGAGDIGQGRHRGAASDLSQFARCVSARPAH